MLLCFIFFVSTICFAYLFFTKNQEFQQLQKYTATIENELLQKQIKLEELTQQGLMKSDLALNSTDPVTGLPVHQVFNDRALQVFHLSKRTGKFFGIMYFNLLNYFAISQQLGPEKTNLLLNELAKMLNGCIRQIDTLSRYKDDHFYFLLPQLAQPESAAHVAERVLVKLHEPFYIDNIPVYLKANIGIGVYPTDGDNLNAILDCAKKGLDKATNDGENTFHFNNENLQSHSEHQALITKSIRGGSISDSVKVYCLPQVDSRTNDVVGVKAIPYWNDAKLGLIPYEEYSKLAEKEKKMSGIILDLLNKVIPEYKLWVQHGFKSQRLAINISSNQLHDKDFIPKLSAIIAENNFDPSQLAFEIIADDFSEHASTVLESFLKLKALDVQLSIGVYAMGHLAIQKVTQLPISYLKIDQRLVRFLPSYPNNENLLTVLMELSHSMGLQTVTEGVDDEKQKSLLQSLGFVVMQGNLFGMPQPLASFKH